jgi:hypothetical protein
MGLSAAGPRQCTHSQVRVPRDSWPYFTVSNLRLPNLEGQVPAVLSGTWPSRLGSLESETFCILTSNFWLCMLGSRDGRHSPVGLHSSLLTSRHIGNHCSYRGNHICLVNCYHRNACSVLCVGVGTLLANRYLVMGDFNVGTLFTQSFAGNGRLRRLRFPVSLHEMWTNYPAWTTFYTLTIIDLS